MITMYDTVTVDTVPPNPPAVAGYTSGWWPTAEPLRAKFPHALHLDIAINAHERARCLDIENGDASPGEAPGWLRNYANGGKPVLYGSASAVNEIVNACSSAGIGRDKYLIWSAHYTYQPHICSPNGCGYPQADATQWTDRALGRNLDESLCSNGFFEHPPNRDPFHYERYVPGPWPYGRLKIDERATVQEYDRLAQHGVQHLTPRQQVLREHIRFLRDRISAVAKGDKTVTYPAGGWVAPGTPVDWQREDQGQDFVIPWRGVVQAPGAGHCFRVGQDNAFPNGFGPSYPYVHIDTGRWGGHDWYIGHCTSLVSPGDRFEFGHPLARADQGHNFQGTNGGWIELGEVLSDGTLGPNTTGHWYRNNFSNLTVGEGPSWDVYWRRWRWWRLHERLYGHARLV